MDRSGKFYAQFNEEPVKAFYDRLSQFFMKPRLIVKLHPDVGNVEWLAGEDLTKGLEQYWPTAPQPEIRAVDLLRGFAKLYGMITDEDTALFRQRLALKQVLRSRMVPIASSSCGSEGVRYSKTAL